MAPPPHPFTLQFSTNTNIFSKSNLYLPLPSSNICSPCSSNCCKDLSFWGLLPISKSLKKYYRKHYLSGKELYHEIWRSINYIFKNFKEKKCTRRMMQDNNFFEPPLRLIRMSRCNIFMHSEIFVIKKNRYVMSQLNYI